MKTLAKDTIVANARFFGNDLSKVPTMALTVGVGTVMDAKEVSLFIPPVFFVNIILYDHFKIFCTQCVLFIRTFKPLLVSI